MSSISLEAFDGSLRGKISQWVLQSNDICALPSGFQDHILSGANPFQTNILLMSKQDSKAWLLSHTWDLTFIPETTNDWSLVLSLLQHLKKPILLVTTPKCNAPQAFWHKCQTMQGQPPTCAILRELPSDITIASISVPHVVFFPKLDTLTEAQFIKIPSTLHTSIQQSIQSLDLRSLYRELRGAGASLCLSLTDSRLPLPNGSSNSQISGPQYNSMWFYPEINGALRLHISDLRMILRTITERLAEPTS
jgi:hypothetical protein